MADAIYHINRKAERKRDSGFRDTIIFAAASDGAAAAIAAIFDDYLASKQVSLTKAYKRDHVNESHPVGTRHTVKAYTLTSIDQVYRMNFRNLKDAATSDHVVALLLGTALTSGGIAITALTDAPTQPTSGGEITVAQVTINTLR